jgi:hypothetical protein
MITVNQTNTTAAAAADAAAQLLLLTPEWVLLALTCCAYCSLIHAVPPFLNWCVHMTD